MNSFLFIYEALSRFKKGQAMGILIGIDQMIFYSHRSKRQHLLMNQYTIRFLAFKSIFCNKFLPLTSNSEYELVNSGEQEAFVDIIQRIL